MYHGDRQGIGQANILCGSLTIPRLIDEADLQRAANEVFRINGALRTRFIEKDGKIYQEFKPFEENKFDILHFKSRDELDEWGQVYATVPLQLDIRSEGSGIPKDAWRSEGTSLTLVKNVLLHSVATEFKRIRYGLKKTPAVCEIKLFYLPYGCGAVLKMHHVVSDAWTMVLVANQFIQILNGETPKAYQYDEAVEKMGAYLQSKRYQRDRAFFDEQLERCPNPTYLFDPNFNNLAATRRTESLDKDTTSRIREFAEQHSISPYIVFLTSVCVYASRKLKRDTFYVGSVALNRTGEHDLNTAGIFVIGVPLLMDIDKDDSFAEALMKVRDVNLAGFRHAKADIDGDHNNLLYDLWVSYQPSTLDADPTVNVTQYYCNYAPAITILSIEDRSMDGQFKLHFDYNLERPKDEVDELFRVTLAVLRDGIADDSKKVSELGI